MLFVKMGIEFINKKSKVHCNRIHRLNAIKSKNDTITDFYVNKDNISYFVKRLYSAKINVKGINLVRSKDQQKLETILTIYYS